MGDELNNKKTNERIIIEKYINSRNINEFTNIWNIENSTKEEILKKILLFCINFFEENKYPYLNRTLTNLLVSNKILSNKILSDSCNYLECKNKGTYFYAALINYKFCSEHKTDKMIKYDEELRNILSSTYCMNIHCENKTYAKYGLFEGSPIFCYSHRKTNMEKLNKIEITDLCKNQSCINLSEYGYKNDGRKLFCSIHKIENTIKLTKSIKPKCTHKDCDALAYFGNIDSEPLYCNLHKNENMKNVHTIKCKELYCNKNPLYNYKGEIRGIYCNDHKLENMINIKSKKCEHEDCEIVATFNFQDKSSPILCDKHKKEGMVNIKYTKCIEENCSKKAYYNKDGEKDMIYCDEHKKEGMVYTMKQKCYMQNCNKVAIYGCKNLLPKSCRLHRVVTDFNYYFNKCQDDKCTNLALYGKIGKKETKCYYHKIIGDKIFPENKCSVYKCSNFSLYGENIDTICEEHKNNFNKDLVKMEFNICKKCKILNILDYDDFCYNCSLEDINKNLIYIKSVFNNNFYKDDKIIKLNIINNIFSINNIIRGEEFKYKYNHKFISEPFMIIDYFYFFIIVDIQYIKYNYDFIYEYNIINEIKDIISLPIIYIKFNIDKNEINISEYKNKISEKINYIFEILKENKNIKNIEKSYVLDIFINKDDIRKKL